MSCFLLCFYLHEALHTFRPTALSSSTHKEISNQIQKESFRSALHIPSAYFCSIWLCFFFFRYPFLRKNGLPVTLGLIKDCGEMRLQDNGGFSAALLWGMASLLFPVDPKYSFPPSLLENSFVNIVTSQLQSSSAQAHV